MEILEYFEKNNRIKNKKIDLIFEDFYMKKLYEIIENELENLKQKIKNTKTEMDSIYNKKDFELKTVLSEILNKIDESILKKKDTFTITYENLETLNYAVTQRIVLLNEQRKKWGRTLNKEIDKEYNIAIRIQEMYISEYNKIMKKLYSKREEIDNKLKDYIEESQYNNFLLDDKTNYNIHISMREKEEILNKLYKILLKIEDGKLTKIEDKTANCDELTIIVVAEDIQFAINKIVKELEKNINSGSVILLNIKDYFILKYCLDFN